MTGENDDRPLLKMRRQMLPPMSPESWKTMDEGLFRTIVTSEFAVLCSPAAWDAIVERAKGLGIELG